MTVQTQTGSFKLPDSGDANSVSLRGPATQAAPVTYTLPTAPVSTGLTLTSTTGGATSWAAAGGLTLGAVGTAPNANGALLTGSTLTLETCDGSNPGAVGTGAQTVAGTKTFTSPVGLQDQSDSNVLFLQAPSTQAASITYTLPTAPVSSTGLYLSALTGGAMGWSGPSISNFNSLALITETPVNGSTSNYTMSSASVTPTWCTAYAVFAVSGTLVWSAGSCSSNLTQQCLTNSVVVGSASYATVTFANIINCGAAGTVTALSNNNISIQWNNPSGNTVTFVLFGHN